MDEQQGEERGEEDEVGDSGGACGEAEGAQPEDEGEAHFKEADVGGAQIAHGIGGADIGEQQAGRQHEGHAEEEVEE